ncbi:MAG: polysaccharide deacetylase family protein, partial [Longimicrobiales bacterium]
MTSSHGNPLRPRLEILAKKAFITGLDVLGINLMLRPLYAGRGVIFALHRVVQRQDETLVAGNAVTVDFLDDVLGYVRQKGWEIVGLGEASRRLRADRTRPFACFTFDDGYRDNLTNALPVFRRHDAPMAVFVCTGYVDRALSATVAGRQITVWAAPYLLEEHLLRSDRIDVEWGTLRGSYVLRSFEDRLHAFAQLRGFGWRDPEGFTDGVLALVRDEGTEPVRVLSEFFLSWEDARELAGAEQVEVGAHSVSHRALAQLPPQESYAEMAESRTRLTRELRRPIDFFAYPYGGVESGAREFGFAE